MAISRPLLFVLLATLVLFAVVTGVDGRSLPRPWDRNFPIRGFEFYDGRVGAEDTAFVGYTPNSLREASGLGFLLVNAFNLHPRNYARALRFVDAKRVYLPSPAAGKDGDASSVFVDQDGSVTGTADAVVTANKPVPRGAGVSRSRRLAERRLERLCVRADRLREPRRRHGRRRPSRHQARAPDSGRGRQGPDTVGLW